MKSAREGAALVTLASGNALVAGGTNGTSLLTSAEIYSPATGAWTTLQFGQSCTVQIVFTPPDAGTFNANLVVTDSSNNTQTTSLTGVGLD